MFDLLPESNRSRARATGPKLAAVTLHLGIVVGAVFGRPVVEPVPAPAAIDSILFFDPPAIPLPRRSQGTALLPGLPALPATDDQVIADLPSPALIEPLRIPDPSTVLASPYSAVHPGPTPGSDSTSWKDEVLLAGEVDDQVVILEQTPPVYPRRMAAAGISGRVALEFVVDTAGRVERQSLTVVSSTDPAFEASARDAVVTTRFRPARVKGRTVRQLARQAVTFRGR